MNYTEEITNYYARLEKTIESLDKEALNQVMNLLQDAYKKGVKNLCLWKWWKCQYCLSLNE